MQVRENLHKWKLHKRWEKKQNNNHYLNTKIQRILKQEAWPLIVNSLERMVSVFCIESFFSCPMAWWWNDDDDADTQQVHNHCSHLPSTLDGQQFSINNPQPTHLTAGHVGCLASHCWPVWWWWLFSYNTLHSLTLKQWMSYPCLKQWNWEKQLGWKLSGLKTIKSILFWKLNLDMGS